MMLICSLLTKDQDEARLMGGKENIIIRNTNLESKSKLRFFFFLFFLNLYFAAIIRNNGETFYSLNRFTPLVVVLTGLLNSR